MTSVKIIYKEPDDRPIEKVEWWVREGHKGCTYLNSDGDLWVEQGADTVLVHKQATVEWARAILKMVEQRHAR